jgi:hypothetical protein
VTTRHDIVVQQGAIFQLPIQALNQDRSIKDLTGYQARFQVRATTASATVLMSGTTEDGRIAVNGPSGIVTITVGADVTAPMTWTNGVWDIEAYTTAANVIRLAEGFASLSPEVTRP